MYYYRARYYDPTLGRFTQRDPIGLAGGINPYAYADSVGKLLTTNLYSYAFNSPSGVTGVAVPGEAQGLRSTRPEVARVAFLHALV